MATPRPSSAPIDARDPASYGHHRRPQPVLSQQLRQHERHRRIERPPSCQTHYGGRSAPARRQQRLIGRFVLGSGRAGRSCSARVAATAARSLSASDGSRSSHSSRSSIRPPIASRTASMRRPTSTRAPRRPRQSAIPSSPPRRRTIRTSDPSASARPERAPRRGHRPGCADRSSRPGRGEGRQG